MTVDFLLEAMDIRRGGRAVGEGATMGVDADNKQGGCGSVQRGDAESIRPVGCHNAQSAFRPVVRDRVERLDHSLVPMRPLVEMVVVIVLVLGVRALHALIFYESEGGSGMGSDGRERGLLNGKGRDDDGESGQRRGGTAWGAGALVGGRGMTTGESVSGEGDSMGRGGVGGREEG